MKLFDRTTLIEEAKKNIEWDVLIIGGGATGLGIAVDAASRGYKTLLAEQEDFAKGTSSRSTKLLHGGVRYLAQGNIHLVREALKERGLVMKNAPHVSRNERFIIPCYSWFKGLIYSTGLKIYDWLSGRMSLGKSKWVSKKQVIKTFPEIKREGLKGGVCYHDGTFDDARLAINLAQTAVENGAVVLNYCRVTALKKNEKKMICGATLLDREYGTTIEINSKVVINATGVFGDEILGFDKPGSKPVIRPSQGIHLVLNRSFLNSEDAIMIPETEDGRVLFAIPWYDKVLIGTTDTPLNDHSLEPIALEAEIEFILKTAGNYFSRKPTRADVLSVFAGLRPLAAEETKHKKTKEISRSHKVIISRSGLVSVIGGKWTTYRKMAEDTLSKIITNKMLQPEKCVTENLKIHGYDQPDPNDRLSFYGTDKTGIKKLIEEKPERMEPLIPGAAINAAQVIWAVRNEMASTVEDVLARRTRILFLDAKVSIDVAPKVAEFMMKELGYDEAWKHDQITAFSSLANRYLVRAHSTPENAVE